MRVLSFYFILVKKGDRIAIMLPNILQYPIAVFGALRAAAQSISYEIAMGFALVGVMMAAGSLNFQVIVKAAAVKGRLMRRVDEQDGHGAPVAAGESLVQEECGAEAQGAGEYKPEPVPEYCRQDHLFIETLAAMKCIGVHAMSLF